MASASQAPSPLSRDCCLRATRATVVPSRIELGAPGKVFPVLRHFRRLQSHRHAPRLANTQATEEPHYSAGRKTSQNKSFLPGVATAASVIRIPRRNRSALAALRDPPQPPMRRLTVTHQCPHSIQGGVAYQTGGAPHPNVTYQHHMYDTRTQTGHRPPEPEAQPRHIGAICTMWPRRVHMHAETAVFQPL